jgi:hypothetical protein
LFSQPHFYVRDRTTRQNLGQGQCENGLYVLKDDPKAFVDVSKSSTQGFLELWRARLGHVSFDIVSLLKKLGLLRVTSLLPKPVLCTYCQLAKGHHLPFERNIKRALNPLDLVHCDLCGTSPTTSVHGYWYYVVFIDDHSHFS